jgi:hypothetical protein
MGASKTTSSIFKACIQCFGKLPWMKCLKWAANSRQLARLPAAGERGFTKPPGPRQKLARQASLPGRARSLRSGSKHTPNPVPPLTTAAALTPQKSLQELPWIGGRCKNSAWPPQARAARLTDGPGAGRRLHTTWWPLDAARLHLSYVVMQRSHGNPLVSFYSLLFMKALLALSLLMIPSILANI